MRRRAFAAAGAGTLGAATAVVALVASTAVGFAETTTSWAGGLVGEGAFNFGPTPYVESTDGSTQTSTALEIPDNPLIEAKAATLTAGDDAASVEILNVSLGAGVLDELPEPPADVVTYCESLPDTGLPDLPLPDFPEPPEDFPIPIPSPEDLPADDLRALCNLLLTPPDSILDIGLVEVYCEGDSGGFDVADVTLLGQEVPIPEAPENFGIPENPLLTITSNKQVHNDDGSFSVTGLELNIGDGTEIISLGKVTCGVPNVEDEPPAEGGPTADKPTPVTTGLPVTG